MEKDEKKRWTAKQLLKHPFLVDGDMYKKEFAITIGAFYNIKKENMFGQ